MAAPDDKTGQRASTDMTDTASSHPPANYRWYGDPHHGAGGGRSVTDRSSVGYTRRARHLRQTHPDSLQRKARLCRNDSQLRPVSPGTLTDIGRRLCAQVARGACARTAIFSNRPKPVSVAPTSYIVDTRCWDRCQM
jgi:hypothetical protein